MQQRHSNLEKCGGTNIIKKHKEIWAPLCCYIQTLMDAQIDQERRMAHSHLSICALLFYVFFIYVYSHLSLLFITNSSSIYLFFLFLKSIEYWLGNVYRCISIGWSGKFMRLAPFTGNAQKPILYTSAACSHQNPAHSDELYRRLYNST